MEQHAVLGILSLGFSLGLVHALDADHIMAVSVLSANLRREKSPARLLAATVRYCLAWSIGHSSVLIWVGCLLLLSGYRLPAAVAGVAEKGIGVLLMGMGIWVVWQVVSRKTRLQAHRHGGIHHTHLTDRRANRHSHQPVLVGLTHGLAGNAPVLALIQTLEIGDHRVAIAYLVLFCAGVLVAMLLFGVCLGRLQVWLAGCARRAFQGVRLLAGAASIVFGGYWLLS